MLIDNSYNYAKDLIGKNLVIDNYIIIPNMKARVQNDFGERNNCSIMSISSVLEHYLNDSVPFIEIYKYVHNYSKKTRKYSNIYGTLPFFLGSIMKKMSKDYNLNLKTKSLFLNNFGFNYNTLKDILVKSQPIILSVYNANSGYYKYHSVVLKGFMSYKNKDRNCRMLVINDNWHEKTKFIDYNTLSNIAMINFFEK